MAEVRSQTTTHQSTAPSAHSFPHPTDRTRISNAERTERDAGRNRVQAVEWHEQTLRNLLRHKLEEKVKLGLRQLLVEITEAHGLGWGEIARLVGVSVPAVRKWRLGGQITPERLEAVARLSAFLDLLQEEEVYDPAAWLKLPLPAEEGTELVAKFDIYTAGGAVDLLSHAKGYMSRDALLSRTSARRQVKASARRIIAAEDGHLSIVSDGLDR